MSGSKPTQDQFAEEFQALEREEKRTRMLQRAIEMRPLREQNLAQMTGEVTIVAGGKGARTTF